jgi:hypothetical protein
MARKNKEKALRQAAERAAAQQAEDSATAREALPVVIIAAPDADVVEVSPAQRTPVEPVVVPAKKPAV